MERGSVCKPGGADISREMKTAQMLALERSPEPHVPAQGQAVLQQVGDGERKTLLMRLWLCQREGDAQAGLGCGHSSSWHRGQGRLLAAAHTATPRGTIPASLALVGQAQHSLRAKGWQEMGSQCPGWLPASNTHCHHHDNRLWPREGKWDQGHGTPLPHVSWQCHSSQHLQQQQETTMHRKKGHTRAVAAAQTWKAK